MTLGSLTLWIAALLGGVAFVSSVRWARGRDASEQTFRRAYLGMTLALAAASVILLRALLTHDFSFHYVVNFSSRDLPLLYLISAFWGGQQGTFLLWALMGALIGYPLFRKTAWQPGTVMACYLPTVLFQIGLMFDRGGNPFRLVAQVPPDGHGLNPLLQDPWMATHPPAVFLGYAAMTVPAALALAALLRRTTGRWLDVGLRWSLIGFVSLGVGIILGGFWAYKVLGWGGYWGWDPVENASLVPWIVVAALLHGLLVQKATGALVRTNIVLALAGYLLVVYATFLTRSGVLADFSVHSFPAGSLYRWLVLGLLTVIAVSVFAWFRGKVPYGKPIAVALAWPFLLSCILVVLSVSAVLVLVGTSWPILSGLAGTPSVPSAPFYNRINLPLYLIALSILGLAPFCSWGAAPWRRTLPRVLVSLALAAGVTAVAAAQGGTGAAFLALFLAASFALVSNLIRVVATARVRLLNTGAPIAHLGLAMMFVGIVASSAWDREVELALPLGHPVEAMDRIFSYRGHIDGTEGHDLWRVAVMEPGKEEVTSTPAMYWVDGNGPEPSIMRKPGILRSWSHDLYVVAQGLETGSTTLELRQDQPVEYGEAHLTFLGFDVPTDESHGGGMRVEARLQIHVADGTETVNAAVVAGQGGMQPDPVEAASLPGVTLLLREISVEQRQIRLELREPGPSQVLHAHVSVKPMMGVLWTGTLLMILGCGTAAVRRYIEKRRLLAAEREAAAEPPLRAPRGGKRGRRAAAARVGRGAPV